MKLFIDFDDVLFNTKKFRADLVRIFLKHDISKAEFERTCRTSFESAQGMGEYYDLDRQIEILGESNCFDKRNLRKSINDFMQDLEQYIFKDCFEFLEMWPKKDLYILTYGCKKFQLAKINKSGIGKYFRKILVSHGNKISIMENEIEKNNWSAKEKIIFIDDRPDQLGIAKKTKKEIITFRVARPEGRYVKLVCKKKDFEVKNLKQVLSIIKKKQYDAVK